MRLITRALLGLLVLFGLTFAAAAGTRVVFVTHGQSGDPYWSVVKNGMDDAAKTLGVKAEYLSPETFDMVKMAQMIDAVPLAPFSSRIRRSAWSSSANSTST